MDLHTRLENHWLTCMATAAGGAQVTRMGRGTVVINPNVSGQAFNFIALRGARPERLGAILETGGALLAGGGRPPAVFLSPASGSMEELAQGLTDLGWHRVMQQAVLCRELPGPPGPPFPEGVALERVAPRQVRLWGRTLAAAYEVDPFAGERLTRAWGSMLTEKDETWWATGYLARVDGSPAGTGLVWGQGEIAGLYCGAVLPAFRRRGIHRATVLQRLADAAQAGCRWATLQTDVGSPVERLCTSELGFHIAYGRELWVPKAGAL